MIDLSQSSHRELSDNIELIKYSEDRREMLMLQSQFNSRDSHASPQNRLQNHSDRLRVEQPNNHLRQRLWQAMEDATVHIRRSTYTRVVYRACSDLSEHILVIEKNLKMVNQDWFLSMQRGPQRETETKQIVQHCLVIVKISEPVMSQKTIHNYASRYRAG